jgi:hypothetical protein
VEVRLTMLKKAKLERYPLYRVELRRILSPNGVIQCHQDIFSSKRTPVC